MKTIHPPAKFYTIESPVKGGIKAVLSDLGASLISLYCADRDGEVADVVTGPNTIENLWTDQCFMGASVGRFGNRVAKGKFSINGEDYQLTVNDGENHLHGGGGLHKKLWTVVKKSNISITFECDSTDGEDGYPGNLGLKACYTVSDSSLLTVEYSATTDRATPINIVQHAYWNLSGDLSSSIESNHFQSDDVSHFLPIDSTMIPTGEVKDVVDTPFDFKRGSALKPGLESGDDQIALAGGYDHCLVFSDTIAKGADYSVELSDQGSGRSMRVSSNMPAIQLYSGNFLDGSQTGKAGVIPRRTGVCLETQHYPDSVNQAKFPSAILEPNEKYYHVIEYRFDTF